MGRGDWGGSYPATSIPGSRRHHAGHWPGRAALRVRAALPGERGPAGMVSGGRGGARGAALHASESLGGRVVGIVCGSGGASRGLRVALAIAIHNIPEGVAVSLPLRAEGVSGWACVGWSILSSLPQPIATIPAFLAGVALL